MNEELRLRARPHRFEIVRRNRQRDTDERRDPRVFGADRSDATHAPNDIPAAHRRAPGYRSSMKSSAARKSSFSPGPPVKLPALAPAPRKLKRSTAQPIRLSALARLIDDLRVHGAAVFGVRMREHDGGAHAAGLSGVDQTVGVDGRSRRGSSSSASRRPAGPGISRNIGHR